MEKFFAVMEGPIGRALRIVFGFVLIYIGLAQLGGTGGAILAFAGILPIAMGLWGPCLVHLALRRSRRA